MAKGAESTVSLGPSKGSAVGTRAGFLSTEAGEEELFLPPQSADTTDDLSWFADSTDDLSRPEVLLVFGLAVPSIPEEPAASWVLDWRADGVFSYLSTNDNGFFEVDS